ncbi:hypothetical protein, partial [Pontibacter qinzhouensis]|uniref:hypothetical protein n=1 Tax=Pontibacter qinzhouensis TaxID=2603253 RepID=UPI00164FD568
TIDGGSESGSYNVKMSGSQLGKVEEVSYNLMSSLELNPEANGTAPDPIYSNPPITSNPGSGSGGGGSGSASPSNVFNTVEVTTNNYQIRNDDHFIKVTGSMTVLMPVSPVNGQLHIFKATYDASVAPVIIRFNNHSIEGENEFYINTPEGSVSFIFQGMTWYQID